MDNMDIKVGNVTKDPELTYTTSGRAVVKLSIAVNRRYQQNGEWQEDTSFFNVEAWADLAENTAASVNKGDRVIVVGYTQQDNWETPEGEKRSALKIVAQAIGPDLRWATAEVSKIDRQRSD